MARHRTRDMVGGLSEAVYMFFSWGDFFEAEGFGDDKSEADLGTLWRKHRAAITARYVSELRGKGSAFAGRRPARFWTDLEAACGPRVQIGIERYPRPSPSREWAAVPLFEDDLTYLNRVAPIELQPWEQEALEARHAQQAAPTKGAQVSM